MCPSPAPDAGQIEYKLKLNDPSPLRLAKLSTQLQWRVIQGGGSALYEIGVTDSGSLIGLSRRDMEGSLHTLGRMLAGIGGGSVRICRVVRLGGVEASDSEDEQSDGAEGLAPRKSRAHRDRRSPTAGFAGFDVAAREIIFDDLVPPTLSPLVPPLVVPIPRLVVLPIEVPRLSVRSTEERDEIKLAKREARRARRVSTDQSAPPMWNDLNPSYTRPIKVVKLSKSVPTRKSPLLEKTARQGRPQEPDPLGPARFVIEALVVRAVKGRRESGGEEEMDPAEEDLLEGFDFLDFGRTGIDCVV